MRYAFQRILQLLIVFVLVTFGVLVAMRLGGGSPQELATRMLGGTVTAERAQQAVREYHLDSNFVVQYLYWLKDLVTFDLGFSAPNNIPVARLLAPRVWTTVLLGVYAIVIGLLFAVPLAVWQAHTRDSWFDKVGNTASFIGVGVPAIVLGVFAQLLFAVHWKLLPAAGSPIMPWHDPWQHVRNFLLPAAILAIPQIAIYARILRADMISTLQGDFITLAAAKGLPTKRVLWRHALRNSLLSLVTTVGTSLGGIIGGAVVVETLFDLDGLGSQLVLSVLTRDLFTVQACIALVVLVVVAVNVVVDLSYAVIDPRVRVARALA